MKTVGKRNPVDQGNGVKLRLRYWGGLIVAVFGFLCLPCAAGASQLTPGPGSQASQTAPLPKIVVENPQAYLGEVMEDGTVSHDFVVRNAGNAPLIIEQVRPG